MNYRHLFHAGNFADVLKHVVLVALITSLARKNTPFCYIDTHAGRGYYDLFSDLAAKTKEYENGIEKIIHHENPPTIVKSYLYYVHQLNNKLTQSKYSSLRYYPGSPLIARSLIRPTDRIVACELQPDEYQSLRNVFIDDKQVNIHHMDGFLGLKSLLPPKERRGLILIDPPYENPDEFSRIAHSLPLALKRFETGIYAIWYPIKEKMAVERFHRSMRAATPLPILIVELTTYPDLPNHLNGSGIAIVNPPWQFNDLIQEILPWLWNALTNNKQGFYRAYFLK